VAVRNSHLHVRVCADSLDTFIQLFNHYWMMKDTWKPVEPPPQLAGHSCAGALCSPGEGGSDGSRSGAFRPGSIALSRESGPVSAIAAAAAAVTREAEETTPSEAVSVFGAWLSIIYHTTHTRSSGGRFVGSERVWLDTAGLARSAHTRPVWQVWRVAVCVDQRRECRRQR
jgi:hypothetical protein